MTWEEMEKRTITQQELWDMEAFWARFSIKAAYDVLLSPKTFSQWDGKDPTLPFCLTPATLKHIRLGWRHHRVLKGLAAVLDM